MKSKADSIGTLYLRRVCNDGDGKEEKKKQAQRWPEKWWGAA
jgi:hypothetical protein